MVDARLEQCALVQAGLATRGTQLVQQRQQHHRNVLVTALQALQVVRQQHHAAHQRGTGLVAVWHCAVGDRKRQALHFLGHHRGCMQLEDPEGAAHLVQEPGARAHAVGIALALGERLDLVPRLAQGFVQLRLDPAERGRVDRLPQRTHDHSQVAARLRPAA